ncbi:MAG: hypothetical protein M1824_001642 [Vezdaea acicularis]|nr:MAG: hypothetical protein M1824_001642 [Vezdaea acicularis]
MSTAPAAAMEALTLEKKPLRYADVGINLTDPVYRGFYHGRRGKRSHDDDFAEVLTRARLAGCTKLMVTGSDLHESRDAVKLAQDYPGTCYATVGVHPCSAKKFEAHPGGADALLQELEQVAVEGKAAGTTVAFGEIGLDYDRLFLCPKETQLKYFDLQLDVAARVQLPLFLHSRAASEDFERLLVDKLGAGLERLPKKGLVHSFTGTREEMLRLVAMGLDIGVNGCSLKTEENLSVVKEIPLERLQIETDGPWCEMRASHASAPHLRDGPPLPKSLRREKFQMGHMVKGRNEPCTIPRVAWVVAKVKDLPIEVVCEA